MLKITVLALATLGWTTGDSAFPDLVYIYGLSRGKPKLLWTFETGDRAAGGYRNVCAENGQLVVELNTRTRYNAHKI
jgi:hypothetical protein